MFFGIAVYAFAMVAANLLVAAFGPSISPINAFVFIGLDLTLRDWLHVRIKPWQMLALILSSGAITYLMNDATAQIATASSMSFIAASLADWGVFSKVKGSWEKRSTASNVAGAAVDSMIFPAIAFGVLMPQIVLLQFAAKVLGGAFWMFVLKGVRRGAIA